MSFTTSAAITLVPTLLLITSSNAASVYGQPVTLTVTVTPASGSGETGTVQFQIDGGNVGSPVQLSGNTASYTTSASNLALTAGTHSITAVYSGDSTFAGSTSPLFTQNVAEAGLWGTSTLATFNASGQSPAGCLMADAAGNLYGMAWAGGTSNDGIVFELSGADHQTMTTLVNFNGSNRPTLLCQPDL